jgi:hypothetical protein
MKSHLATVTVGTALALLLSAPALAGTRDDVIRAMDHCGAIVDKDERLACFDKLSPMVKEAIAQMPRSGPPTAEEQKSWFGFDFGDLFGTSPRTQTTPEQFGSEALPAKPPAPGEAPAPEPIDSITAKVAEYSFTANGKFIIFLDNGQVWRQIEGDTGKPLFSKRGDNVVKIERGVMGSYNLMVNDSAAVYKVKRIR